MMSPQTDKLSTVRDQDHSMKRVGFVMDVIFWDPRDEMEMEIPWAWRWGWAVEGWQ